MAPKKSPRKRPKKSPRLLSLLDPDKLGGLAASLLATIVMGFCFFHRRVGGFEVAVRVVLTFAISYAAVFVLVACLRHIVTPELAEAVKEETDTPEDETAPGEQSDEPEAAPEEVEITE